MKMCKCIPAFFVTAVMLFTSICFAQQKTPANSIVAAIDSFANRVPTERTYLHIDKPYYTVGDTIWMKAYVLDGALSYSKQSGLLYVELINDTGKVAIRQVLPVKYGVSVGQMELDVKNVQEGAYTLRAYTNWMQNQGEESFFTRQLYISNPAASPWLVNRQSKLTNKDGKDNLEMALQMAQASNKQPITSREVQLKVMNGDKVLSRDNMQTDVAGKINFNLNVPDKVTAKGLTIVVHDAQKGEESKQLVVPVAINRAKNIDLQFMPEGGTLVAGLECRVGFKALGEDGAGTNIKGVIIDSKNNAVASFESSHAGMGNFIFTPQANETYTAKATMADGSVKNYALPQIHPSGLVMMVNNIPGRDSLILTVQSTATSATTYVLIGESGGKACYASELNINPDRRVITGKIAKSKFLTGIARFTLFDDQHHPLAGRIIYIDHKDALHINIATQPTLHPTDSIGLKIKVTDKAGNPVIGTFSLAVTDDNQVKADSAGEPDMASYMLLTGALKGNVEQPGYYFNEKNAGRYEALDNLLLTQGWIGYNWTDIFNPVYTNKFKAEPSIEVSGSLSRVGGKSLDGLTISLLSIKKPRLVRDTLSDKNGRFVFKDLPRIDTASFVLQVKDKKGKMFEANINVDEFKPAKITLQNTPPLTPWYVNTDSTLLNYNRQNLAYEQELDKVKYPDEKHHLKEVIIKDKKIVKGSHNLNGPGQADQVFDEQDMKKLGKITLEDMLNKGLIKGFGTGWFPKGYPNSLAMKGISPIAAFEQIGIYHQTYQIYANKMHLVIDGVDVHTFFQPAVPEKPGHYEEYNFYKTYLKELTAEDIRSVEVLYNNQYNNKYKFAYLEPSELDHTGHEIDPLNVEYAYLEITTWSGNGAYMHRVIGRYLYNPPPVSWPKQFYKPKYSAKGNPLADLRSTILWEPNIITDKNGTATIWFNAKSKPGTYNVVVQGSDLSSAVGVKYQTLKVVK